MEPTRINWSIRLSQVIGEITDIPPDVSFKIVEDDIAGDKKFGVVPEVKAHKLVLGLASPVFRRMFFVSNTQDKTAQEITVEQTTKAAFQIMINAIYDTTSMEDSLKDKSVDEIFTVLDLVEKYQIPELLLAVKECVATFPITDDNVLQVAADALEWSTLFQGAQELLLNCARFLKTKFKDTDSVFQFVALNEDQKDVVHKLLALMNGITLKKCNTLSKRKTLKKCNNCRQEVCQDGIGIEASKFRVGLKVINMMEHPFWVICLVTGVNSSTVKVMNVKAVDDWNKHRKILIKGNLNWKFCCKY